MMDLLVDGKEWILDSDNGHFNHYGSKLVFDFRAGYFQKHSTQYYLNFQFKPSSELRRSFIFLFNLFKRPHPRGSN